MIRNSSIATIQAPEFIKVTPHNELISECEIKVLYVGENRNHSFITKEVATQMANSLPGTPIVAAYLENKDDFGDHGHVITVEDGEVKFSCKTVPYGFVDPNAKVWFQKFIDTDVFGNQTEREYLMTNGYLWTGQYPEIQKVIDEGMPQSMELDEETLDGYWTTNTNSGYEFFIINDANFSKLCILGSDVEPCFEGASVTSTDYSLDTAPTFVHRLLEMRNELYALQNEGGSDMLNNTEEVAEIAASDEIPAIEFNDGGEGETGSTDSSNETSAEGEGEIAEGEPAEGEAEEGEPTEDEPENGNQSQEEGNTEESEEETEDTETGLDTSKIEELVENDDFTDEDAENNHDEIVEAGLDSVPSVSRQEFACGNGKKKYEDEEEKKEEIPEEEDEVEEQDEEEKPTEAKKKSCHSLEEVEAEFAAVKAELETVKAEYAALQVESEAMKADLQSLREFRLGVENQRKEQEIAKYSVFLNEDVLSELNEKKAEYTLDELKSKLALLYVENNVSFSMEEEDNHIEDVVESEDSITTFSLDTPADMSVVPEWVQALCAARN